jgi:hypothetical protein
MSTTSTKKKKESERKFSRKVDETASILKEVFPTVYDMIYHGRRLVKKLKDRSRM